MIKYWNYLLIVFLTIGISKTFAQKQHLKLNEAYEAALAKYPGVDIKESQIKAAEYNRKRVKSNQLPQVKLQLQNAYGTLESSTGAFFPLPGTFNVSGNKAASGTNTTINTFGSAVADWEIFSFGKLNKENKAASLKVTEAESDLLAYQLSLKNTVSRLFLAILYNDVKLNWASNNALRVREILEISKSLANAGLKPGADTALASSSYLQIESDQDRWNGKLKASKYHLNEFTALDIQKMTVESNRFLEINHLSSHVNDPLTLHPYLNKINDQIKYHNALEETVERSVFPSVSLLGGISTRSSGAGSEIISNRWVDGFQNQKTNYLVGLGLTWNLTGIYDRKIEQKRIEQNKLAAQFHYKQQELELNTGINSSRAQIAEQIKQVQKTEAGVEKAREAYNLYRTRYENGLINLTELLQIQLLLQQAEEKQIEALKNLWEQVIVRSELTGDFNDLFELF